LKTRVRGNDATEVFRSTALFLHRVPSTINGPIFLEPVSDFLDLVFRYPRGPQSSKGSICEPQHRCIRNVGGVLGNKRSARLELRSILGNPVKDGAPDHVEASSGSIENTFHTGQESGGGVGVSGLWCRDCAWRNYPIGVQMKT
tara:strand:- start:604 stop:1035 length:432 start_codon:yes stop_codon:yes gene_type:complete